MRAMYWLRRCAFASLLAALLVSATGCGGPTFVVQQYGGPKRDTETIAIVRFLGTDDALLVVIDGERADVPLEEDTRLHIEVLPGEHEVGVVSAQNIDAPLSYARFRAEPGKVYRVAFASPGKARVFEVDASSDTRLRDVTLEPPIAPPPSPPPPRPVDPALTDPEPEPEPEPEPAPEPAPEPEPQDGGAAPAPDGG